MQLRGLQWIEGRGWRERNGSSLQSVDLVFYFTSLGRSETKKRIAELKGKFSGNFQLIGCSSAGEIFDDDVYDDSFSAVGIKLGQSKVEVVCSSIKGNGDDVSFKVGVDVAKKLKRQGLRAITVISDGLKVNGTMLVDGIRSVVGNEIVVTGGLAGDKGKFVETFVAANSEPLSNQVGLVGWYGDSLTFSHASKGGWDEFGPVRKITKSKNNILISLDNQSALTLYKTYLGPEHIAGLPGSALLFPIFVYPEGKKHLGYVRTVLGVDQATGEMTFAGDLPENWNAQLMRANFDHLIAAAGEAAKNAISSEPLKDGGGLALLVSCVGRKMVLGQRSADEVESVLDGLGGDVMQIGFYSYGEISPLVGVGDSCALHNQTMTITLIQEK